MSVLLAVGPVVGLVVAFEALTGVLSGPKAKPIDVDCNPKLMAGVRIDPRESRIIRTLKSDNDYPGQTPDDRQLRSSRTATGPDTAPPIEQDPLFKALQQGDAARPQTQGNLAGTDGSQSEPRNILILSGGGAWGAFGAGFLAGLEARQDQYKLPRFAAITGVSTGAVQGLLLATGPASVVKDEYVRDAPIARTRGNGLGAISSLVRRGGLTDLSPMIARIETLLVANGGARITALANGGPLLLIGAVEAGNGQFRIFDFRKMAQNARDNGVDSKATAQCMAGVVAASSAVPLQMLPVRLRLDPAQGYVTYVDGGVRQSVFDEHVATVLDAGASDRDVLYVIRNGPTRGRQSPADRTQTDRAEIDVKPHVLRVVEASQAAIINQNELSSIELLHMARPKNPLHAITADAFNGKVHFCADLPSRTEPFPPTGMKCLAGLGDYKAGRTPPWIDLTTTTASSTH